MTVSARSGSWGDPVLRTACDPVTVFDDSVEALCDDLIDTVTASEGRAGLAANQIGVGLRAFSWYVDGNARRRREPPRWSALDGEQDGRRGLPVAAGPVVSRSSAASSPTVEGVDATGAPLRVSRHRPDGALLCSTSAVTSTASLFIDLLDGELRREALRAARGL